MSSVRKNEQSPHRFTLLDVALELYDHTTTVTANPKIFTDQIHPDMEYLQHCLTEIETMLFDQKMTRSKEKTFIQRITDPIEHLGFVYRLTRTGKVVILARPDKIKHEKKKVKRMVNLVKQGKRTKRDADAHFKAFKASVAYGNSHHLIHNLNVWYRGLWKGAD